MGARRGGLLGPCPEMKKEKKTMVRTLTVWRITKKKNKSLNKGGKLILR